MIQETAAPPTATVASYERLPTGELVERRTRRGQDQLVGLLDLDVQLLRTEWSDPEGPDDQPNLVGYVIGYTDPATGESVRRRVPPGQVRSGDWVWNLPLSTHHDHRRARVWAGICATSPAADSVTVYRATGWRLLDGPGWTYIHAGGGITRTGVVELAVDPQPGLRHVGLPDPLTDPTQIRSLFDQASLGLMTRLESHVGAALVGAAYRAPLGWTPAPTIVYGATPLLGAVVGLTTTHFGATNDRPTDCLAREVGSTQAASRVHLHAAKDCLYVGADIDQGRSRSVGAFLSQFSGIQSHTEPTHRTAPGRPSRATVLLTAEIDDLPDSPDVRRMHLVPVDPRRLDVDVITDLNSSRSRLARATVMASLLSWMAADLPAHRAWAAHRAQQISAERRPGEALVALEVGWELAARFLVGIDAYTRADADLMLADARQALGRKPSTT